MKKAIVLLALCIIGFGVVFAQKPKIEFEVVQHDFGTFKEEAGNQTYQFKFKNTGDAPLIVNNVLASCGCTSPSWSREPILPGKEGHIAVSYKPRNRPGAFNKQVRVISNGDPATVFLRIKGKVLPRERTLAEKYPRKLGQIRMKSNHLTFTEIKDSEVKTDSLSFINDSEEDVVVALKNVPQHLTVQVLPERVAPKQKGQMLITYDATKKRMYGFTMDRIYFKLNGVDNYQNSIGVSATITEDFSALNEEELKNAPVAELDETLFNFGEITQGEKVEKTFTIKNTGKRDLIIRRVRTTCGCTAAQPAKKVLLPGEKTELKISFNSRGKMGRQSKPVTIITNDPNHSTLSIRLTGTVKRT